SSAASHPPVPGEVSAAIIRKNQPRRFTSRGGAPLQT
ncbi:L-cystine ABC transporter ATP-binding protein YecC, partial [Escherichia coli]